MAKREKARFGKIQLEGVSQRFRRGNGTGIRNSLVLSENELKEATIIIGIEPSGGCWGYAHGCICFTPTAVVVNGGDAKNFIGRYICIF